MAESDERKLEVLLRDSCLWKELNEGDDSIWSVPDINRKAVAISKLGRLAGN